MPVYAASTRSPRSLLCTSRAMRKIHWTMPKAVERIAASITPARRSALRTSRIKSANPPARNG